MKQEGAGRSLLARVAVAIALAAVGGVGFWAGRATLSPPPEIETAVDSTVTVEVTEQDLGRVLTLTTTVSRPSVPVALNHLSGVITAASDSADAVPGGALYTVGETPVRAVIGETPFWRDLAVGTRGRDVAQLRAVLVELGHLPEGESDRFTQQVSEAVKRWQRDLGQTQTGTVRLGELVAFPSLPVPISVDADQVRPGAELVGGESLVRIAEGAPTFEMILNSRQIDLIPPGASVVVHGDGADWLGVVGDVREVDGQFHLAVAGADGGTLCGDECSMLPATESLSLLTDVIVVPPVSGPVVPVSSVTTGPDGSAWVVVVGPGGDETREVEVLASVDGLAVVSGVESGDVVRVFGSE